MPQEKRKSLNYRSFVICDDPRGIVECQAIRKSNTFSPQKREQSIDNKVDSEKKQQKRSKSLAVLLEEDKNEVEFVVNTQIDDELAPSKPSFKLANHVISLPNDGVKPHPKNVAKDLFKGALNDLQKPWFSSKKSLDEMKKVVRESLMRQCVISNPVFEHHLDSPDVPSTSNSSQSSMVYSSNFALSDMSSSVSSGSSLVKAGKSSSLMFKLMGLEPFPSSPLRLPKPQFGAHLSLKQRSMDDILEALRIKGLIRSNGANGMMPKLLPFVGFPLENESDDGKPPIVVIKPSRLDPKEPFSPKGLGENGLGSKDLVAKPRSRRRAPIKDDGLNLGEEQEKPAKKLPSLKGRVSNQKTNKVQENVRKGGEVVKVSTPPNRRKVEEEEEEKKVVRSSSDELRSSPRDQTKLTHLRNQKNKDTLLISKNHDSKKSTYTSVLDHQTRRTSRSSSQLEKRRQQPVLKNGHKSRKDESKQNEAAKGEKDPSNRPVEARLIPTTENDIEEQISLSGPQEDMSICATEDANNGHDPEVTQVTPQEKPGPETSGKFQTPRTRLKALLLTNPSFVNLARSLFDLDLKPNSILPFRATNEDEGLNVASHDTKLLLDCANEVMEFRSLQISQACLPFPRSYFELSKNALTSDRLLEDICKGIEDLKGYLGPTTDNLFSDILSFLIDRDLRFKSGTWEIGWRNTCSQCEVELVIGEVDELVLGSLIEEIVVDFML